MLKRSFRFLPAALMIGAAGVTLYSAGTNEGHFSRPVQIALGIAMLVVAVIWIWQDA